MPFLCSVSSSMSVPEMPRSTAIHDVGWNVLGWQKYEFDGKILAQGNIQAVWPLGIDTNVTKHSHHFFVDAAFLRDREEKKAFLV